MSNILKKKYFPHLNATRFIAFIPVFLTHCFYTTNSLIKDSSIYKLVQNHLELGLLGLDYFFVLSSFLISWIIYEEQQATQKFNIFNFYIRRTIRIFPLYFLVVILGFFLVWLSNNFIHQTLEPLPPFYHFGLFILNFYMIDNGFNFLFFLTFFWSVSVEEQFYIGWALLSKYFLRYAHWVAILLIVISLIFRFINLENNNKLVFHTVSSLSNFGIGCLLSYVFMYKQSAIKTLNSLGKQLKLCIYLLCLILMLFYSSIFSSDIMVVFERFIFALLFAAIIADFSFSSTPLFNLEKYKWMNYFGQLSFGLYCYHGIVMTILIKVTTQYGLTGNGYFVFLITPLVALISTLILAHVSYKYFELPILKLKKSFM